jgi:glycerophosphoryl diester phosphodiesterase
MEKQFTQVWAHRGASGHAPENTLTAFRIAADMGADGVELDVQLTKDGRLVVIHDETIDRVSDGTGRVKDYTLAELKRFNFNKKGITKPLFMEIPTLEETLETLHGTDLIVNIELKTGVFFYQGVEEKAVRAVRARNMGERVIYSSFNHYSVTRVKELDPSAKTGLLFGGGVIVTAEVCEKLGVTASHPDMGALRHPRLLRDARARGVKVHAWTANAEADLRYCFEHRVDAVVTNFPDAAIRIRDEYHRSSSPSSSPGSSSSPSSSGSDSPQSGSAV